jgi:deuterolysin
MAIGEQLPFQGIELSVYYEGLESKHYEKLAAGSSITRLVDLSSVYDFQPGTYSIVAEGTFPSVSGTFKEPTSISFKSKALSITVKESSAAEVKQILSRRSIVETEDCPADKLKANLDGVRNCETLARAAAADAADVHSARFVEYFKSNETEAREHVSGRLLAVAKECSTTDSGDTRLLCRDDLNVCETDGPLIAYTTWVNGYIVMCPLFYDTLPPLPRKCHKQDHATTTIHEMTHARAVYEDKAPATADRAYGYENSTALTSEEAMYNADSYSLYANGKFSNLDDGRILTISSGVHGLLSNLLGICLRRPGLEAASSSYPSSLNRTMLLRGYKMPLSPTQHRKHYTLLRSKKPPC